MNDFEPWILGVLEENGYTDTNEGLINKVAKELNKSPNNTIDTEEFVKTCIKSGVDPYSFTKDDLNNLQRKLKK